MGELRNIAGWPTLVREDERGQTAVGYDNEGRRLAYLRAGDGEDLAAALAGRFGYLAPGYVPSFEPPYRSAAITVTGRCNMRCPYCFVYPVPRQADMPPDVAARAVRALAKRMPERAQIYLWGGEPTLNMPACVAALDAARDAMPGRCTATVTTNGAADGADIRRLAAYDFCELQISYDGPKAIQDGQKLLDGGSYERVLRSIDAARSGGREPILRLTVTADNLPHMRAIFEDVVRRGLGGRLCVEPVHSYVGRSREGRFGRPDAGEYVSNLLDCLGFAERNGLRVYSQPLRVLTDAKPYHWGFINILPDGQAVSTISVIDSSHPDAGLYRLGALEGEELRLDGGGPRQARAFLRETAATCARCPLFAMCTGNEQRDFFLSGNGSARYRCEVFLRIVHMWMERIADRLEGMAGGAKSGSFRVERPPKKRFHMLDVDIVREGDSQTEQSRL